MSTVLESKHDAVRADDSHVVRLSVNLAPSVAEALKSTAAKQGITITEAIRRAVALWKMVSEATAKNQRIMIVEGTGDKAQYKEIFFL
ncbi:ribbon-helix-helix protein, CopG family [Pengzhenrongella sp.]|jgi:hypothetical protein|uniref:ribbon-helix-helix protein, CopG family n=1 Tax=Pengzhenrongella sp. TaxID=2888820 RepID=UPI002F939EA8